MARPPRIAARLDKRLNAMSSAIRREVVQAIRRGALAIENYAVESIIEQTPSGKFVRSRGNKKKMHEVSPPGSAPNADTGELHTGITSAIIENSPQRIVGQTASNSPYGEALEFGTTKMEPRPFMGPAFDANRAQIEASIAAAVKRGAARGKR